MRLAELDPRWFGAGGEGIYTRDPDDALVPVPERKGVGVSFLCPCLPCAQKRTGNAHEDFYLRVFIPFSNPLDGGPPVGDGAHWDRVGDTFDSLTLSPSILRMPEKGGCGWHGFVRNGAIE